MPDLKPDEAAAKAAKQIYDDWQIPRECAGAIEDAIRSAADAATLAAVEACEQAVRDSGLKVTNTETIESAIAAVVAIRRGTP